MEDDCLLLSVDPPFPWLMYVWVFMGGVTGSDWLLIALAVAVDLASCFGSAYGSGNRSIAIRSYSNPFLIAAEY